jgi:prepilin-type N-terminal cleavage/methylation domain-containing protein
MHALSRGFTLIELLVVIAIVAVLAVTVILTLNPAQLLRQARDSNRLQDLATLKSSLALYLADVAVPTIGTSTLCYAHTTAGAPNCGRYSGGGTLTQDADRTVDGNGWIPVNFSAISAGSPISNLPVDPVNNATYYYAYKANATTLTFEFTADMESTKFANGGANDLESTDGGNNATIYETGTEPGLDL